MTPGAGSCQPVLQPLSLNKYGLSIVMSGVRRASSEQGPRPLSHKLSVAHCKGQQLLQTVLGGQWAERAGTPASCNLLMASDMIMI